MANLEAEYFPNEIRAEGPNDQFLEVNETVGPFATQPTDGMVRGTVMGRITAAGANQGFIVPWDPVASDGSEVAVGILNRRTNTVGFAAGEGEPSGVFKKGNFVLSKLVAPDNTWVAQLGGSFDTVRDRVYL